MLELRRLHTHNLSLTTPPRSLEKHYVRSLFDAIAYRYDFLNHLLSGGVDFYWRRKAIDTLLDLQPQRILDVATGTGDFAIAALRLKPREVTGVDIAEKMLSIGREKIERLGATGVIRLMTGEAEHLAFPDNGFDAAIVAFGARNFEHLRQGLAEMRRVIRPGGRLVILEFSKPSAFPFRQLYFFYFRRILPLLGRVISGDRAAYTYLPETVMQFPEGDDFLTILRELDIQRPKEKRLTFGIATIYTGEK